VGFSVGAVSVVEALITENPWFELRVFNGSAIHSDMRIMPWLCLTYLVLRIDVNNVANAAIMNIEQGHGIKKDLHLSPQQWTWVVVSCS
jgi:hypothetical protein